MSTNVGSVVSFFPDAENGFTTTLASTISSGAVTVPLNSVAGYTNGLPVVFVIDPTDPTKKQTFTGIIDTAGVQVTSVVWTAGTNQTHTTGATVVDYATATHIAMISKGITQQHSQTGAHTAITATSVSTSAAVTVGNGFTVSAGSVSLPSASISQAALPLGAVVQVLGTNFSSVASGSTVLPSDNTIPQITEGNEYMTLAITPKATTNILVIEALAMVSNSAAAQNIVGAIFQDSTLNALAAGEVFQNTATAIMPLPLAYTMVAGTTSSTTFRVRVGGNGAGTTTFNGSGGVNRYSTTAKSFIKITEYKA